MSPLPSPRGPGDPRRCTQGLFIHLFMYSIPGRNPHFLPSPNKVFIKDSGSVCVGLCNVEATQGLYLTQVIYSKDCFCFLRVYYV